VLLAMEKAIENMKLNDRAMHYHFIALKQEWLGYVSHFTLYSSHCSFPDTVSKIIVLSPTLSRMVRAKF
jgi:hypothetical protein